MSLGSRSRTAALAGVLVLGLNACASQPKPLYSWGDYQTLIYKMYAKPGEATPAEQVDQLTQNIQQAETSGMQVAPGIHAQLGYMAYLDGKPALAGKQFAAERMLYPESAPFMTRLLSRMQESTP